MATQFVNCQNCQTPNDARNVLCMACGSNLPVAPMPMQQVFQPKPPGADKRIAAGLCGILLGGFGVHKFILGYTTEGVIMAVIYVVGLFLCGIPSIVIHIIGIVEGIMYLTKSDEEFSQTYVVGRKPWL